MSISTYVDRSRTRCPVQSDLPLFDGAEFDAAGFAAAAGANTPTYSVRLPAAKKTKSPSTMRPARSAASERSNPVEAALGRDPLKQAQRVARQLRRGEFDTSAKQAAVKSLCQHLIDSLQSQASSNHH